MRLQTYILLVTLRNGQQVVFSVDDTVNWNVTPDEGRNESLRIAISLKITQDWRRTVAPEDIKSWGCYPADGYTYCA